MWGMRKLLGMSLLLIGLTVMAGCGKDNPVAPEVKSTYPSMDWYQAHHDEMATVSLEEMTTIINRAYAAYLDSAIDPVRTFIWDELKSLKTQPRRAEPMDVESYSIFTLNWQENLLLLSEPWNGLPTNTCRNLAMNETGRQWPNYNQFQDKADGFRHAYWNILMCRRISEDWARKFSSAHEYGSPNGLLDAQMDLNNNGLGRAIWRAYIWSKSEAEYSTIVKDWRYTKVDRFDGAVPYIIYLAG